MDGRIGDGEQDAALLRHQIEHGESEDKLKVAVDIAVAFIRWSQDLKRERDEIKGNK